MNQSDGHSIEGKVVAITGASSGLGEATAVYLAGLGAKVVLAARRTEKLEALVASIVEKGGEAICVTTDVTKSEDLLALVKTAVSTYGQLDVMVNNAGYMAIAPFTALKVQEWEQMIDINIKGVLYGIAAALPQFENQGVGHFINISSVAGIKVFAPGGGVYSGTKFAVSAISEGLRQEVGGNIRTTTIHPGVVESELRFGISHEESSKAIEDFYKMAIPADSIARAIAYAIEQPGDVDVNELTIRPTLQEF